MTPDIDTAAAWIGYAAGLDVSAIFDLLSPRAILAIGGGLADNRLLNPPARCRVKHVELVCQCGCGERFMASYTTKRPKYKDNAHRQRAYRRRKAEREWQAIEDARPRATALERKPGGNGFRVVHQGGGEVGR